MCRSAQMGELCAEIHVDADVWHHNVINQLPKDAQGLACANKKQWSRVRSRGKGPDSSEQQIGEGDILSIVRIEVGIDLSGC
jgi:hypothetical protein